MTSLICNRNAGGGHDTLTDEHSASSYGQPVLVHMGQALGPDDLYDDGFFGLRPVREVGIRTTGLLSDEQVTLVAKWERAIRQS